MTDSTDIHTSAEDNVLTGDGKVVAAEIITASDVVIEPTGESRSVAGDSEELGPKTNASSVENDAELDSRIDALRQAELDAQEQTARIETLEVEKQEQKITAHRGRVLLGVLIVLFVIASSLAGGFYYLDQEDKSQSGIVPQGVQCDDISLAGLDETGVRKTIGEIIDTRLSPSFILSLDNTSTIININEFAACDIEPLVASALNARGSVTFINRIKHDYFDEPISLVLETSYIVDEEAVTKYAKKYAKRHAIKTRDAKIVREGLVITIKPEKFGRKIDAKKTARLMTDTVGNIIDGNEISSIEANYKILKPKVLAKKLKAPIVTVSLSQRKIFLYNGDKLVKTYRCAVGEPRFPTPSGDFYVGSKRFMPSWSNPAPNGWGAGMPATIPPGPSNPLGMRAINLYSERTKSDTNIRFHGTQAVGSIGSAASHGCLRMINSDVIDLFGRLNIGTKVYIVP